MFFSIGIGNFLTFAGKGNFRFAILEWKSKFELRFDDYIAQCIRKSYQPFVICYTKKPLSDIIRSVIIFEYIEQLTSFHVYTNDFCIRFVFIYKAYVSYRVRLTEPIFAIRDNGISTFVQVTYGNTDFQPFFVGMCY